MRIYLDVCCFNRPYDNQDQLKIYLESQAKLQIQEDIINEKHELVWSFILSLENQANPFDERRIKIAEWKNVAAHYCGKSNEIVELGTKIMNVYGIKSKDALHIACAINQKCDYFLTTDRGILKKNISEINVVDPIEFIRSE